MKALDTNFDSKTNTFRNNIYGSSKGLIRTEILSRDLNDLVKRDDSLSVLDLGGGQGQMALWFAKQGCDVTLVDISDEMLQQANANASEKGLSIKAVHASLQDYAEQCDKQFDIVLCHAVFEWLEQPEMAVPLLSNLCRENGFVSLMFFNQAGQILSNLVYGNFDYIKNGMKVKKPVKLNPQSALDNDEVLQWCQKNGLVLTKKSGVRCFHDYLRDLSKQQSDYENILELELKYSEIEPYASIGRYTHYLLKKEAR